MFCGFGFVNPKWLIRAPSYYPQHKQRMNRLAQRHGKRIAEVSLQESVLGQREFNHSLP
jgi:hypothetical protein